MVGVGTHSPSHPMFGIPWRRYKYSGLIIILLVAKLITAVLSAHAA